MLFVFAKGRCGFCLYLSKGCESDARVSSVHVSEDLTGFRFYMVRWKADTALSLLSDEFIGWANFRGRPVSHMTRKTYSDAIRRYADQEYRHFHR